jgi:tetratricopeptide (TPR) repeat protein
VEEIAAKLNIAEGELREGRKQLNNLYLIKAVDDDRSRFAVHSLTRQFLQWKLAQEPDTNRLFRETFVMSLLNIAKQIPQSPTRDLIAIASVAPAIPHLDMLSREILDDIPNPEEDLGWAFEGIVRFYEGQGLYALAEDPSQRRLNAVKKILGDRHPDVATSLNNLALLYYSQGRYEAAEPLYLEALSLWRELLGDRHPDVATSLNNLAMLYKSQGKYETAEPLHQQALSLRRELLGDRHSAVADSLLNLATLYYNTQRYSEALQSIQPAIQIYEQTLGTDHPTTQAALSWLQPIQNAM